MGGDNTVSQLLSQASQGNQPAKAAGTPMASTPTAVVGAPPGSEGSAVLPNFQAAQLGGGAAGKGLQLPGASGPKVGQTNELGAVGSAVGTIAALAGIVAALASSKTLKTDIEDVRDVHDLAKMVYGIPVRSWRYKWDAPQRRRVGPLLEDTPKVMHEDRYRMDAVTTLGLLMAAAQSQNKRLEALEGSR